MPYRIRYTEQAKGDLRGVPGNDRQRIRRLIESLAATPRPGRAKELRERPNRYRIRIEGRRLIYRVDDDDAAILILRVRKKVGTQTYADIE